MKILPKLIEMLKKANTIEEKKKIFLDAGIELDDKELDQIASGINSDSPLILPKELPGRYEDGTRPSPKGSCEVRSSETEDMTILTDAAAGSVYG